MSRIRAFIVDDSALMRKLLTDVLSSDSGIEVLGAANDPIAAWSKIQELRPDVITLDVEMPKMDGLTFLDKLMRARPTPVVMISTLTERGAKTTLRALELGAVDFVAKPKLDVQTGTVQLTREIIDKVKAAARARPRQVAPGTPPPRASEGPKPSVNLPAGAHGDRLIALGASTGGTEALRVVLSALPADTPPIVVVQHMPAGYTKPFAARLDTLCRVTVTEAQHGERLVPGHAYIAAAERHLRVARQGGAFVAQVVDEPRRNHHRPSVDVLFESIAKIAGRSCVAAILTGMGDDGARGMLDLRFAGATTLAQDEASCVVFGMPKEAIAIGAVQSVLALDQIAGAVMRGVRRSMAA